jgi:hypothetical protein
MIMNFLHKSISLGICIVFSGTYIFAQSALIYNMASGFIDYEGRIIVGEGKAMVRLSENGTASPNDKEIKFAQALAKKKARENISQLVKQVNYNGITLEEFMQYDPIVEKQIASYISSAFQYSEVEILNNGHIQVEMAISMIGLSEIVFPSVGFAIEAPKNVQYLMTKSLIPKTNRITGIIIDARNTSIKPALAPRIVDENGNPIYGMNSLTRSNAINKGLVAYASSLGLTKQEKRVGNNPIIIKALNQDIFGSTNPVVSLNASAKLKSANKSFHLFDDCKVLILVD